MNERAMPEEPFVRPQEAGWTAKEVVRELYGVPHLLVRVTLAGTHFVGTAPEPFVRIGEARSRFVQIDDDGMHAHGYFDTDPPEGGKVEFGSGRRARLVFPNFSARRIERLDRTRLPRDTRMPDRGDGG